MENQHVNWLLPYLKSLSLNEPFAPNTPTEIQYQQQCQNTPTEIQYQQKGQNFGFTDNLDKIRNNEEHCSDDFRYFKFEECSVESMVPPVAVSYQEGYGRFLQASRNIEAGETIFWESPLVLSPKGGSGPTCLNCFSSFTDSNSWPVCEHCRCPKCNKNCEGNEHTEIECKILAAAFQDKDISINVNLVKLLNIILTPLRTYIAIKESPAIERIIESLQSNASERKKSSIGEFIDKYIVNFFQKESNLNVDSEFVHHVCGVFDTNAFDVTIDIQKQARALLPLAALLNHSCVPNTQHWFLFGYLVVRACVPILKGETITNSYTQALWCTKNRTNHLALTKLFKCTCKRCQDPSELGSNLSSIRCQKCKEGFLTPMRSSTVSCSSCGENMSLSSIMNMIIVASGVVTRAENLDLEIINKTIQKLSDMISPQHYTTVKLKFIYLKKIVDQHSNASINDLVETLSLIESLLQLTTKIEPGLTRTRGVLLYYKFSTITEFLFRYNQKLNNKDKTENQLDSLVNNILSEDVENISEECESILKWDTLLEDVQDTRARWKTLRDKVRNE